MSAIMKRAFDEYLTVDRYAGNEIHLLVGKPAVEESVPPPSDGYLAELSALRRLSEQGDGMRAFMGMLLTIETSKYRVIVVDEPEAFLHPPQARLFGRILAEQHATGTQVIIATHSEDIVQGVTSISPPVGFDPTIIRINRRDKIFKVSQISVEKVQQLYHDPLLRHSSVLGGLFYQGVAVCEGDSDCTYYQAVLSYLIESGRVAARDVHFMHCGGKARIWKAVDALRAASVPTVAIVDFDVLKSDDVLAKLVGVSGGDFAELTTSLNVLRNAITSRSRSVNKAAARSQILAILDDSVEADVTNRNRDSIAKALSGIDGWRDAKSNGSRMLTGDALQAFNVVDVWLRRHGVFVVPNGELESFNRLTPSGDKGSWLAHVLEGRLYASDTDAHTFIDAMTRQLDEFGLLS